MAPTRESLRVCMYACCSEYVSNITKRTLLSVVSKHFHPIGLIAPVLVVAKVIIQSCWKMALECNDAVPDDVSRAYTHWKEAWIYLVSVKDDIVVNPHFIQMQGGNNQTPTLPRLELLVFVLNLQQRSTGHYQNRSTHWTSQWCIQTQRLLSHGSSGSRSMAHLCL